MKTIHTQARRCQAQLMIVLAATVAILAALGLWRWDLLRDIYLADAKNILLNGAIVLVFAAGVWKLLQAFGHYDFEEKQLTGFLAALQRSADIEAALAAIAPQAIIAGRCEEIMDLFARRVPIHHGALSAIMVAEQAAWTTFARYANNVLILTGVFGTIFSLLFALVGASRTLGTSVAAEGVAQMLAGMNTALNTSVTAMTCFFIYTYFYGRLTDLQTAFFGRIEKAVLTHIVPRFAFDTDAVNHQTVQLIQQLEALIVQMKKGTGVITDTLSQVTAHDTQTLEKLDTLISRHDNQLAGTGQLAGRLEQIQSVLIKGFRLNPKG